MMNLATGQFQRRALSLPNEIIFGAMYAAPAFRVFSSEWRADNSSTVFTSHKTWVFTDAIQFLQCYSFLCNLAVLLSDFRNVFNDLKTEDIIESLKETAWRPIPTAQTQGKG